MADVPRGARGCSPRSPRAPAHHTPPPAAAGRTCRDVAHGEQAYARVPVHRPLEGLAVGLAAVVHEPRVVALGAGIDDAVLQTRRVRGASRRPRAAGLAYAGVALATVASCAPSDRSPQSSPVAVAPGGQGGATDGASPGAWREPRPVPLTGGHRSRRPSLAGTEVGASGPGRRALPALRTGTGREHGSEQGRRRTQQPAPEPHRASPRRRRQCRAGSEPGRQAPGPARDTETPAPLPHARAADAPHTHRVTTDGQTVPDPGAGCTRPGPRAAPTASSR